MGCNHDYYVIGTWCIYRDQLCWNFQNLLFKSAFSSALNKSAITKIWWTSGINNYNKISCIAQLRLALTYFHFHFRFNHRAYYYTFQPFTLALSNIHDIPYPYCNMELTSKFIIEHQCGIWFREVSMHSIHLNNEHWHFITSDH